MKTKLLILIPGVALMAISLTSCWQMRDVALGWEALAAKTLPMPAMLAEPREGDDNTPPEVCVP